MRYDFRGNAALKRRHGEKFKVGLLFDGSLPSRALILHVIDSIIGDVVGNMSYKPEIVDITSVGIDHMGNDINLELSNEFLNIVETSYHIPVHKVDIEALFSSFIESTYSTMSSFILEFLKCIGGKVGQNRIIQNLIDIVIEYFCKNTKFAFLFRFYFFFF
jgi:hypothetical protein